ncbi:MAG TPA: hypothetical protein DCR17_14025 [Verrucomicrobiales bacterium]|nr:hypothetical protein [Verrucomicrobiales bacterium]HAQ98040.1 hypothetical protein [Verrucomicrobiales bacterium]HCZ02488.1 hypothetical protein [Verrucomicrobiales bacterium]|tara:strand:- start:109 stop:375 length:267 start_codon:yes stop_codon:yes gene_type:complete
MILRDVSGLIKSSLDALHNRSEGYNLTTTAPCGLKGISADPGYLAAIISKLAIRFSQERKNNPVARNFTMSKYLREMYIWVGQHSKMH